MDSEILETMLEDFKSDLINYLDGTNRYSEIRISYLKRAIKEIESELKKNKCNMINKDINYSREISK